MYNKLPVKERIELMKSYRKANKDMSYRDMVKDYNDSYEKFKDGGKSDGMTGLMKSKIATEAHYGNPAALRMVSPNPKTGITPEGIGTHYMSSFDNYAVPLLQDKGNKNLEYIENPPISKEDIRFNSPEEAQYFAEHYKEVAPIMRNWEKHKYGGIQKFGDGGEFDDEGSIIKNKLNRNTLAKEQRSNQDNTRVSNLPIKTLQALQQQADVERASRQQYKQQPVISQGKKLNPTEQAYSDKVQARIANPSNDLGITAANMASVLTRFRYLNPEEIATTTNNPMGTVGLSLGIMTEGLINEMAGPAFGKALTSSAKTIKASKESGILSNAYKYNPKAYANVDSKLPDFLQLNKNQLKNKYLRQTGKPQYEDFLKEGKLYGLGQKEFMEKFGKDAWDDAYNKSVNFKGFNVEKAAPSNFFGKEKLFFPATRKPTGKGYKGTANSDAEYLFETKLPDNAFVNQYQQKYIKGEIPSGGTATLKPVYGFNDAENFNLYKKDWWQGYRSIKK